MPTVELQLIILLPCIILQGKHAKSECLICPVLLLLSNLKIYHQSVCVFRGTMFINKSVFIKIYVYITQE